MFGPRSAAFLVALASLGAVGVSGQAAAQAAAAPVLTLTEKDAGSTHNIKVGDKIIIKLPESPSTGYSWGLSWESGGFEEVKPATYERPAGSGAGRTAGGAGTKTFYFKVTEAGANPMTFVSKRWFDDNGIASKMFVILFNTAPAK